MKTFLKWILGYLCVGILRLLRLLPTDTAYLVLNSLLPIYQRIRRRHGHQLIKRFRASPFAEQLNPTDYYRMRLKIALANLQFHGRKARAESIQLIGEDHLTRAIESNHPVILLGLHSGAVELLHKAPQAPPNKPFFILTSHAFASPLSRYMQSGREMDGKTAVFNNQAGKAWRTILQKNGIFAMMADQHPAKASPRIVLWGALEIPFSAHPLVWAMEKGAIVIPISTQVLSSGNHLVRIREPLVSSTLGYSQLECINTQVQIWLEQEISRAPLQWNWSYGKYRVVSISKAEKIPYPI